MGTEDNKLENVIRVYERVISNFPEIDKNDLTIEFSGFNNYASLSMVNVCCAMLGKDIRDPTISYGTRFMDLEEYEQEVIIAHELGHYTRYKDFSMERINYVRKLRRDLVFDDNPSERIISWRIMDELYADNKMIEAGYGLQALKLQKKQYKQYESKFDELDKLELQVRIKNLEDKLNL